MIKEYHFIVQANDEDEASILVRKGICSKVEEKVLRPEWR